MKPLAMLAIILVLFGECRGQTKVWFFHDTTGFVVGTPTFLNSTAGTYTRILDSAEVLTQAHLDSICAERGHNLRIEGITLLYCPPRIIDLPDRTIEIIWDENTMHGYCRRCGREIWQPVQEKPDTVVIWEKN